MTKKTVVIGMSGGVDSSVSALLLKEQGYNVIGLFMKNWEEKDNNGRCSSQDDFDDVRRVADSLSIPYYTVNFTKEYQEHVFSYFIESLKRGRTPNPDVLCNREIKFGPFLEHALSLGADYIATGHYAQVEEAGGKFYLKKAVDLNKDQTYFLNQLNPHQLSKVIFPIGHLTKPNVREIAKKHNLSTASKKDSTGLCFIGERNFKKFLSNYLPAQIGDIKTLDGKIVGKHDGLMYYTLGQRRGLNLGGMSGTDNERWFVVDKDLTTNTLYVTQGSEELLNSTSLIAHGVNIIPSPNINIALLQNNETELGASLVDPLINSSAKISNHSETSPPHTSIKIGVEFKCYAKFRYRQPDQQVKATLINKTLPKDTRLKTHGRQQICSNMLHDCKLKLEFIKPQRAVTQGQYAVLYDDNGYCLGGGEIDEVLK